MEDQIEKFLSEVGLSKKDLDDDPQYLGEMTSLRKAIEEIESHPVTIDKLKEYLAKSKAQLIREISKTELIKGDWLSTIAFLIPIIGIVRKWYQDQKRVRAEIELSVFTQIEDLLAAPEKKKAVLRERLLAIKNSKG